MTANERALLLEIVAEAAKRLRPKGDARLAGGLQASGMATVHHVDDKTIRVLPTETGRRWVTLIQARTPGLHGRNTRSAHG